MIREEKRRRGYGTEALLLAEREAAPSGCVESLLYVADADPAARALYEKCGYELLRRTE